MVYITGDIHGQVGYVQAMINIEKITHNDTIALLGDVGVNYYGNDHGDRDRKKKLNAHGIPILCIHGNHEMRPESISTYRETEWNNAIVYAEDEFPNLLFAKDGEIYDLDGYQVLAIGGAYSVDWFYRRQRGFPLFPDEQPSDAVKARVKDQLDRIGWQVDAVFSHTCPYRYIPREAFLPGVDQSLVDNSTEHWLDSIEKRLSYQFWYCGHFHIEKWFYKMRFLFRSSLCLNQELSSRR